MTAVTPISLDLVEQLSEELQNTVQLSPPAPVVADSAEAALDMLFTELVVDPAAQRFRFEKKHRAQASTRRAYAEHNVPREAIKERAPVTAGVYDSAFDFAVSNGEIAAAVIHPEEGQDAPAFEEAVAAFDETGVTQLTPDETNVLGQQIAERLQLAV